MGLCLELLKLGHPLLLAWHSEDRSGTNRGSGGSAWGAQRVEREGKWGQGPGAADARRAA